MKSNGSTASIIFRSLGHRARLAVLEAGRAGEDLVGFAILIAAAVVLGIAALVGFHVLLLALLWDSDYKPLVVGSVVTLEAAGCIWAGLRIRSRLLTWSPFQATREQCEKDAEWIDHLLSRKPPE